MPVELSTAIWALDTPRKHDLSAYDADHLDLAFFRGVPLATLDGPLANACRTAGVEVAS